MEPATESERKEAGKTTPRTAAPRPSLFKTPEGRKKLLKYGVPGLVVFGVLCVWGLHWIFSHESTDDAFVDAHVSTIAARVEGQVVTVAIDDNQQVKKGDLLAQIDPSNYQAKLDQARANLLSAQAAARKADLDLARYLRLLRTDDTTRQQVDTSRADADSAHANVLQQQAALEQAALDLAWTHIVAPADGRVTKKTVEPGDYLKVGTALLAIVPDKPYVTANFKETQLKHMKVGQSVKIKVDSYPGRVFKGHVDSIQSGTGAQFSLLPPENATGNYVKVVQRVPVKILIDTFDAAHRLVPGMSVVPTVRVR